MLKHKTTRLAATSAVALGAIGLAIGLTGTASAASAAGSAASAHPAVHIQPNDYEDCSVNGNGICADIVSGTWLLNSGGGNIIYLPAGSYVEIICYYQQSGSNAIEDHVSWSSIANGGRGADESGHVDDNYVDLGGHSPSYFGLPTCG
jgi:hypothetical protein